MKTTLDIDEPYYLNPATFTAKKEADERRRLCEINDKNEMLLKKLFKICRVSHPSYDPLATTE